MANQIPTSDPRSFVEVAAGGAFSGTIRPPGSKSITNRALICAAFADGPSRLAGALRSEDTEVMVDALRAIGVSVEVSDGGRQIDLAGNAAATVIDPSGSKTPLSLFIANSGTTVRFLTAALSAAGGRFRLHGVPRMHGRPIGDLVQAIAPVLQGEIHAESPDGCPPVSINSAGWSGDCLEVAGNVSSQYLSGLLMAAPISGESVRIRVRGELVSRPYVNMTKAVMRAFGVQTTAAENSEADGGRSNVSDFVVEGGPYRGCDYIIEPDASAASYFWAAAAIAGGTIIVEGLSRDALQGDVGFCDVLAQMGCEVTSSDAGLTVTGRARRGLDVDMNHISDTVQTLAVVALFADSPTRVRGVAHNRFKETDRIGDLARELRKFGAVVEEHEDGMTIIPPADPNQLQAATVETYDDHRMAMSLALAGLRIPGVRILNPACTGKTYPDFFADLESLTGRPHRWAAAEQAAR